MRTGFRHHPRKSRSKMDSMGYMNAFWHLRFAWMNLGLPSPPETSATQHLVPPMHNGLFSERHVNTSCYESSAYMRPTNAGSSWTFKVVWVGS